MRTAVIPIIFGLLLLAPEPANAQFGPGRGVRPGLRPPVLSWRIRLPRLGQLNRPRDPMVAVMPLVNANAGGMMPDAGRPAEYRCGVLDRVTDAGGSAILGCRSSGDVKAAPPRSLAIRLRRKAGEPNQVAADISCELREVLSTGAATSLVSAIAGDLLYPLTRAGRPGISRVLSEQAHVVGRAVAAPLNTCRAAGGGDWLRP